MSSIVNNFQMGKNWTVKVKVIIKKLVIHDRKTDSDPYSKSVTILLWLNLAIQRILGLQQLLQKETSKNVMITLTVYNDAS